MRLDKLLELTKQGSRRRMKQYVQMKKIKIDGVPAYSLSQNVDTGVQRVVVNGQMVLWEHEKYIMLHKPSGVVSAVKDSQYPTVVDLIREDIEGLYPVGRLDRDTEGLVFLTNNGPLGYRMLHPKFHVEKVYEVIVNGALSVEDKEKFAEGIVFLDGAVCKAAKLEILWSTENESRARVTLSEGKFHQVKKMFLAVGVKVTYLKRVQFGPLHLDETLTCGAYRELNVDERKKLVAYYTRM